MVMRMLIAAGLWWLASNQALAAVQLKADREQVTLGDTFNLIVIQDGGEGQAPDLAPLEADFELVRQSHEDYVKSVDGHWRRFDSWVITLKPRRSGELAIPALAIGDQSGSGLLLRVVAPTAKAGIVSGDVALEVKVLTDTDAFYVGQTIALAVRLYYRHGQVTGQLHWQRPAGLHYHTLLAAQLDQGVLQGEPFEVLEWRYLLWADQPGSLKTGRFVYQGVLETRISQVQKTRRELDMKEDGPRLQISAEPADFHGPWLAASHVEISQDWPDLGEWKVGVPVTRRITLKVEGSQAALPVLDLSSDNGFSIYADQNNTHRKWLDDSVQVTLEQSFIVVPDRAGELTLPGLSVPWFDVRSGRVRQARLPGRTIKVAPAHGPAEKAPAAVVDESMVASRDSVWRWLLVLPLMILQGWLLQVAYRRTAPCRALYRALRSGEPVAIQQAVLRLGTGGPHPLRTLNAVALRIADSPMAAELQALERAIYAGDVWRATQPFWRWCALRKVLSGQASGHGMAEKTLPPLYPPSP